MDTIIVDRQAMLKLAVECLLQEAEENMRKASASKADEVYEHYTAIAFERIAQALKIRQRVES